MGEKPLYQLCTLLVRIPIYVVCFLKIFTLFFFPPLSLSPPRPAQNNNRGGYNAGDQDTGAFDSEDEIYYMVRLLISLDCFFLNMEIRRVLHDTDL